MVIVLYHACNILTDRSLDYLHVYIHSLRPFALGVRIMYRALVHDVTYTHPLSCSVILLHVPLESHASYH